VQGDPDYYDQISTPMCYAAAVGLWVQSYLDTSEWEEAAHLVDCADHLRLVVSAQEAWHQTEDPQSEAITARKNFELMLQAKLGNAACEAYKRCLLGNAVRAADVDLLVRLVPHDVETYTRNDRETVLMALTLQV
jgi:hypothetical protein